jgi:hypothetical protein
MSGPSGQDGEFSMLCVAELAQAYVDGVQAADTTEHIGRKNRLARQRWKIVQELKARGEARSVLERLAGHSDARVRASARIYLDGLDKPALEVAPKRPLRPESLWQCDHPPPRALTRDEIAEHLRRGVPEFCDRLMDLALPAIGLWPQRRAAIDPTASRFGGTPVAPPDWQWPTLEDEPLLFVGQINFAELRGVPGAELLPPSGLLAFFVDYDGITGCEPSGISGVYHWPDVEGLVPAAAPIEPSEIFPPCAVVPRPILDLPHPLSRAVSEIDPSEQLWRPYFDVWLENRDHGIPPGCVGYAGFSKLLGWPDLVQSDLWGFQSQDDARLLLQADKYCNGEDFHSWGPGGSLYFVLPERDLRARVYAGCEFEGQFT